MIRAVGITKANAPEAFLTDGIEQDLQKQNAELPELHIDRAYLSSNLVKNRNEQLQIFCKGEVQLKKEEGLKKVAHGTKRIILKEANFQPTSITHNLSPQSREISQD